MNLNHQAKGKSLTKIDCTKNFMHALESEDFEEAKKFTTDDFIFEDPGGSKFDITYFINVHSPLINACQPWTFGMTIIKENRNSIFAISQIKAKHTNDLIHPMLGIKIPATNIDINLPKMSIIFTFSDNKISYLKVSAPKDGGLNGLLHQIGYKKTAKHDEDTNI